MSAPREPAARHVPEITRAAMLEVMELMGDVNPIHSDEALVRRLGLRGLVNQGPANMTYVIDLLLAWAGGPEAIRRLRFRFHENVVPGDRPVARAHVTGSEVLDGETLTACAFSLELQDGTCALSGTALLAGLDA